MYTLTGRCRVTVLLIAGNTRNIIIYCQKRIRRFTKVSIGYISDAKTKSTFITKLLANLSSAKLSASRERVQQVVSLTRHYKTLTMATGKTVATLPYQRRLR